VEKIRFLELVNKVEKPWEPEDVACVNQTALRVAKIDGAYHWHTHRMEDELFVVLKGKVFIDTPDETIELDEMEGYVVKRGTRHRSRADSPAWILLLEPKKTRTKGD
jgi:mannose-6-phosphate isomerase-like protein (cupin superfamily)